MMERPASGEGWTPDQCYKPIGGLFVPDMPKDMQEFTDLRYIMWDPLQLKYDLKGGVLPSGLILRQDERKLVVMGGKIRTLEDALRIVRS